MGREATGSMEPTRVLSDGTRVFPIRVTVRGERERISLHERRGCVCGCGGGWDALSARTEMGNILARIRAGVWERPQPPETLVADPFQDEIPAYDEYSDACLEAKVAGVIGKKPIRPNTRKGYEWRLGRSQRFFAGVPVDEIDEELCLDFKASLLAEAREVREAMKAGADLRHPDGRKVVPLGPSSIQMNISALAWVLDQAIEDKHRDGNPARSERMAIETPRPNRTFLELDELSALLEAANEQEALVPELGELAPRGGSAEMVAALAAGGKRPAQIAAELGVAKSTVTYHLRRLKVDVGNGYVGRPVVCELLARAGLRASELCDLKIGCVRLHDPNGARLRIDDAKTPTGIRVVEVTPALAAVIERHLFRLRQFGSRTDPEAYLVPNLRGGRMSRQRVRRIVVAAAKLASRRLVDRGLPPLPKTTPHTLRRTYISIALLANEFDVKFVMDQVGHADSKTTMDVYAQLQQRIKRSHGTNFDRMLREAGDRLAALPAAA